jgi:hypothetical protein
MTNNKMNDDDNGENQITSRQFFFNYSINDTIIGSLFFCFSFRTHVLHIRFYKRTKFIIYEGHWLPLRDYIAQKKTTSRFSLNLYTYERKHQQEIDEV